MTGQTVIPISVGDEYTLDQFLGAKNAPMISELISLVSAQRSTNVMYIWGDNGVGKSHLLNACCEKAKAFGRPGLYLNLQQFSAQQSLVDLQSVQPNMFVCIDNLDCVVKLRQLQQSVFTVYEAIVDRRGSLLVSGLLPIREQKIELEDLKSRLASGGDFAVEEMADSEKKVALQNRAQSRGFNLDDAVIEYILSRFSRNTHSLFALLDKLDSASLKNQRKVTIPFIRSLETAQNPN